MYTGESKIIHNVDTCCAVGYTAGWAWRDTCGLLVSYCCGADVTLIGDLCHEFCVINSRQEWTSKVTSAPQQ
jgi:hypothetical protein